MTELTDGYGLNWLYISVQPKFFHIALYHSYLNEKAWMYLESSPMLSRIVLYTQWFPDSREDPYSLLYHFVTIGL